MLKNEALWFNKMLSRLDEHQLTPILDIGSGSEYKRKKTLPRLDKYIFSPLKKRNLKVFHLDLNKEKGVDIVGDINNKNTLLIISTLNIKSIFCMNLLEHVEDRISTAKNILSIIPSGGYIFISCPYNFPKHPDPIDTMFRPNINELMELFPNTTLIKGEIVNCGDFFSLFDGKTFSLICFLLRFLIPIKIPDYESRIDLLSYIKKEFTATCMVLQKN